MKGYDRYECKVCGKKQYGIDMHSRKICKQCWLRKFEQKTYKPQGIGRKEHTWSEWHMVKVAFFQCTNCGEWRYTDRKINPESKYKCFKCGNMTKLKEANKEVYDLPSKAMVKVRVLQAIKARGKDL